jgi:biopolymer transport protein ExbB/TolQ
MLAVPNQQNKNSVKFVLRSLGMPLALGLVPFAAFLMAIKYEFINNPMILRYVAGHEISYIATGMFFVGLAALGLKAFEVLLQYSSTSLVTLEEPSAEGESPDSCGHLLESLKALPAKAQKSYLWQRFHDALLYVQRKGSADDLDDELKYLGDMDAARQHEGYSLVRILIWATPMLGFLGTVMGITLTLENFGKQDFGGEDLKGTMDVLLGGLYLAFDTTALALSLSVVLMFIQFFVDRFEMHLLTMVDQQVSHELVGRFETTGEARDPHLRVVEKMAERVADATEDLVTRQSRLWQGTIDAAHQRWSQLSEQSGSQLEEALSSALDKSLEKYSDRMKELEEQSSDNLRHRWEQWQVTLSENARLLHEQQKELTKQGAVMAQAVQATGDVIKLEQALNNNLNSLAGAKNFEDTVMSLSAAIHLLNTQLGQSGSRVNQVVLGGEESEGRAA